MNRVLIHAWLVHEFNRELYLPYTHWIYLKEISSIYDEICLLSPTVSSTRETVQSMKSISLFENVNVFRLPTSTTYRGAIRHFFSYVNAYRKLSHFEVSYVRFPTPFGWLQRIFIKGRRLIHYVGDPVDTVNSNKDISWFRKKLLSCIFLPEYWLYLWASRSPAKVFANGVHQSRKLSTNGVDAKTMISSTLTEADFYINRDKVISKTAPRIIYAGYLRKAKGVETVLKAFQLLQTKYPDATLSIVGGGESEQGLRALVEDSGTRNVEFYGHVEDRAVLNMLFRTADIFCFASVSEGSPRVILEAMANGLNVVSTPVGSLPFEFERMKDIVFAEFDEPADFAEKMSLLIDDSEMAEKIRNSAFDHVRSMTIENFIHKIFK